MTDKLAEALEPCPWCGGTPTMEPWKGQFSGKSIIYCDREDCPTHPEIFGVTADAVARWNRRPAVAALPCDMQCNGQAMRDCPTLYDEDERDIGHMRSCTAFRRPAVAALMGEGASIPTMDVAYRFMKSNPLTSWEMMTEILAFGSEDKAEVSGGRLRELWRLCGGAADKKGRAWVEMETLPVVLRQIIDASNALRVEPATPPSDPVEDRRAVIEAIAEGGYQGSAKITDEVSRQMAGHALDMILALPAPARAALRRLLGGGK